MKLPAALPKPPLESIRDSEITGRRTLVLGATSPEADPETGDRADVLRAEGRPTMSGAVEDDEESDPSPEGTAKRTEEPAGFPDLDGFDHVIQSEPSALVETTDPWLSREVGHESVVPASRLDSCSVGSDPGRRRAGTVHGEALRPAGGPGCGHVCGRNRVPHSHERRSAVLRHGGGTLGAHHGDPHPQRAGRRQRPGGAHADREPVGEHGRGAVEIDGRGAPHGRARGRAAQGQPLCQRPHGGQPRRGDPRADRGERGSAFHRQPGRKPGEPAADGGGYRYRRPPATPPPGRWCSPPRSAAT